MEDLDEYFKKSFPGESFFARCNRSFRKFISVNSESQLTKRNLKSSAVIKAETLRHILFNPNVIHSFSRFRMFWETLMIFTYGLAFLFTPINVAFAHDNQSHLFLAILGVINIICLLDIALNFCSSYQDKKTKRIVLDGMKIVVHSFLTLWVDLLSSFPDSIVHEWMQLDSHKSDSITFDFYSCFSSTRSPVLCSIDFIVVLSLLKFLRFPVFLKYLARQLERLGRSRRFITIVQNLLSLLFWYHFIICINFLISRVFVASEPHDKLKYQESFIHDSILGSNTSVSDFDKYITCLFYTTYTVSLFASTIEEYNQVDMTVGIILTLIGFILHIWLVSKTYMYLRTTYWPDIRFHEMHHQLLKFTSFKGLSKSLQKRILTFYEFSFRGKFFRKREIGGLLGNELCHLIAVQTRKKLLQENFLFNQIPDGFLDSIADCLVETVYLADDIICKVNSARAQKLYLIVSGTVAVYSEEGDEVAHLHSGMFGEIAFLINHDDLPSWNYIAAESTVILTLRLTDFMKILAETPEVVSNMRVTLIEHYSNGEAAAEEERPT